ncbi:hypothetical protein [Burkholderia vietnamiensis]|nr:hypothetical protein [Burkholderia vietnamiensis]MCA8198508.1 hypothetical protein [Burkholderia vietnamiensis]
MGKADQNSPEQRATVNAELAKDIPGFGFVAVRPDGSYFTGVRPADVLQ